MIQQTLKTLQSLHKKKFRKEHNAFLIEGKKIIQEALLHQPNRVQHIFALETAPLDGIPSSIPVTRITDKELSKISALQHPQDMLAVCSMVDTPANQPAFQLALDTIQDPGNMGTILRLAAWFGVDEVLISEDSVDIYNPKVVQASMGAIFTVAIRYVNLITTLTGIDKPIYGALLEGTNVYRTNLEKSCILLMGNEGNGISPELLPFVSHPITIPKFGQGESLNVAMATGILLSELRRAN